MVRATRYSARPLQTLGIMRYLLFTIDSARYAIVAETVLEMVRAVTVTSLPGAPAAVAGIINVRGSVVPVFDMRLRFGAPPRRVVPEDHFVLVSATGRTVALHVDTILDLADLDPNAIANATASLPATKHIGGVAPMPDGLVLIHDVDTFLSGVEAEALDTALAQKASAPVSK
jgi:purine-binding chemotaxis protein CheW